MKLMGSASFKVVRLVWILPVSALEAARQKYGWLKEQVSDGST
jgi:hypothetical protein